MIIKENVTIYMCDHCDKKYYRKHACIEHEPKCNANIDNQRICGGCDYLTRKGVEHTTEVYDGEATRTVQVYFCSKLNTYVYPPIIEHRGNPYDAADLGDGQIYNIPMKKECDDYKENLPF